MRIVQNLVESTGHTPEFIPGTITPSMLSLNACESKEGV